MKNQIAERMKRFEGSSTVKIGDKVNRLKAEGHKIISFSVGEPDFSTPAHIVDEAVLALRKDFTKYTASSGIPELRDAVAEKSRNENDIPCNSSNVIITPSKHGIFASILACVNHDDEVIVPEPAWVSYVPCIRLAGGKPVPVKQRSQESFRLAPEDVAEKITQKTKMIILNSPSNPTGAVMSKEDMKGVAQLVKDHDLIVLTDEIYEKIIYEGKHHSIASFDGMFERTITVNGLSKSYAMTGWRLGWVIADKPILSEISKIQQHTITCATSFVQKGAVAALKGPQDSVHMMVEDFKKRRDLIVDGLNAIDGFHCTKPKGAFYVFPKFDFNHMTSEQFTEFLLDEAKIAVTPGTAFGECGEGFIRMSYATTGANIKEGLKRIAVAVEKLKAHHE